MPQRTNEFQQLIRHIEEHFAGSDATVTESKLLVDSVSGEQREVDIVIEIAAGLRPLVVGIECTATSRPVDVTWIEKTYAKHQHLPIDKTVLVSRAGFRKPALAKAKFLNIQALTLAESEHQDWIDQIKATRIVFFVTEPPQISQLGAYFHPKHLSNEHDHVDPTTYLLFRQDGRAMGTIADAVAAMVEHHATKTVDSDLYRPELAGFDVEGHLRAEERFYTVDPKGNELDIVAFEFKGFMRVEVGVVELTPAQYGTSMVAHGTGSSESFTMRVSGAPPEGWVLGQPIEARYRIEGTDRLGGRVLRAVRVR